MCKEHSPAGTLDREELISEIARMLSEWEEGDEMASEFADRLLTHVEARLATTLSAKQLECLKELALLDCPKLVETIDGNALCEEFLASCRQTIGLMNMEPPYKR